MKQFIKTQSLFSLLFLLTFFSAAASNPAGSDKSLKEALEGKFYIGTAVNSWLINGGDAKSLEIVKKHFNSIVAENCMKSENIHPEEGKFHFKQPDKIVEFGEANNMFIVGHTLIWHSQAPKWFFIDKDGNDVSRDVLIERMRFHISEVVGRYKGRVHGWDVVNEAINDDGSYRESKFYQIIGEDYVELAFKFAAEADPNTELYYNDYGMANPGRRAGVIKMVEKLQAKGIKIDGIGMQGHLNLESLSVDEVEKSIVAFSKTGLPVLITEFDLTILPWPTNRSQTADIAMRAEYEQRMNPYADGFTKEALTEWSDKCTELFRMFLKHHDKISRVTTWGVTDNHSWKNNWPIPGRTDYPLLFDRNYQPKPVVQTIIEEASKY
ncbi:endo-1,4-beta-xylanase [Mariniphaga anaerophila]|uniref:Beta-xylanase n=1 Tax=Mariniphaga anaerophila TaxID=1484053 RepID=A0A1M4WFZ7_9BACT|nr:endo-1,4-beta-xylanase [Mariniphaga anaerophila]SHE80080.1 endo-1,4-beta-xylanase [Mariniphaga anaerophila]